MRQTGHEGSSSSQPAEGTGFGSRAILDSLQAFSEVANSLSGASEVAEVCEQVVAVLKARLGLKSCSVMLLSDDGKALVNVAGTSPRKDGAPQPQVHRRFQVGEGIAGTVVQNGQPILVPDTDLDERFSGGGTQVRVRSLLCLPISAAGTHIGVLNLSHGEPGFFFDEHITVFGILTTILGKLVSEARLRQELAGFNRDLEQQVAQRTREIQASHAYLENIMAQASDIILTVDWRGRVTFVNRRVAELGYQEQALIGQPFSVLCKDGLLPPELMDAMAGTVSRNVELSLSGPDVASMESYCSFSPMEDAEGGGQGALVLVRDVSGTKMLEAQVRQMDKLTSIGTLVSGIAHEINNKLVPILVYSELLQRASLSENDLRLIGTIHKSATGARHIMDSLLRFSRQEMPKMQRSSLNQVVEDVVGMVQFRSKKQDTTIACSLGDTLPDILMDEQQLAQVVLNIINNAYDALESQTGHIQIDTTLEGDRVRVSIVDNGPGIPKDLTGRVFDPFFTTKEVGKGTGLGLSLCYGIIQDHQGEIILTSGPEGTRFDVMLPVTGPGDGIAVVPDTAQVAAPAVRGELLVAGDDPVLVEVLEHVLGEHHSVVRAGDGSEVIRHLQENDADVLVLDMKLPDMGGEAILTWLEAQRPQLVGRAVFLTGTPDEAAQLLGDRVARSQIIAKPFKVAEVRTVVDRLLAEGGAS
jgi:two-component system NtrC family sensor kinase